jgi:hypothetical protein
VCNGVSNPTTLLSQIYYHYAYNWQPRYCRVPLRVLRHCISDAPDRLPNLTRPQSMIIRKRSEEHNLNWQYIMNSMNRTNIIKNSSSLIVYLKVTGLIPGRLLSPRPQLVFVKRISNDTLTSINILHDCVLDAAFICCSGRLHLQSGAC